MHVASLELSKTLFELSGWGEEITDFQWYDTGERDHSKEEPNFVIIQNAEAPFYSSDNYYPAYDAGYLLRKLDNYEPSIFCDVNGRWHAQVRLVNPDETIKADSDNPEDCLILLAIKLFENNILTRKEDK